MDEPKSSKFSDDVHARIGSHAEPTTAGVRRLGGTSTVVFCGDAEQVGRGFAIALRAMGLDVNPLEASVALSAIGPIKEDDHDA